MTLLGNDGDTAWYGWVAAIVAGFAYGTYGVPIKATKKLPVHPLVFQTYKTSTMFICCWFVLAVPGVSFSFSPWGLISGLLWVLGGTMGVIAVRYAGMAIAVGTWASVMICVNFVWGILIFEEPVANETATALAFLLLTIGLVGMSKFSETQKDGLGKVATTPYVAQSPVFTECSDDADVENTKSVVAEENEDDIDESAIGHNTKLVAAPWGSFQNLFRVGHSTEAAPCLVSNTDRLTPTYGSTNITLSSSTAATETTTSVHVYDKDAIGSNIYEDEDKDVASDSYNNFVRSSSTVSESGDEMIGPFEAFGQMWTFSKRNVGITGAVMNGILTGTSFVPVHYAKAFGFGGAHYMVSYAIGALVSNIAIWVIYIVCSMIVVERRSGASSFTQLVQNTYDSLPQLYFKQMWLPGFCAGLLLTIAMFGSLIAVTDLGQGVGNSLIQAKILISGMWGIFYYKEIRDREKIRKWFISACVAVAGILWLSYERLEADKMNQYLEHHHVHSISKASHLKE